MENNVSRLAQPRPAQQPRVRQLCFTWTQQLHLCDAVKNLGRLSAFSCFRFENNIGLFANYVSEVKMLNNIMMILLTIVFLPRLVKVTVAGTTLIRMFQWSHWRRVSHPVHVVLSLRPMSTTQDTIQIVPRFVSTGWTVTEDMTFIVPAVSIDNEK